MNRMFWVSIGLVSLAIAALLAFNYTALATFSKAGEWHTMFANGFEGQEGQKIVDASPALPLRTLAFLMMVFLPFSLITVTRPSLRRALALGTVMIGLLIFAGALLSANSYAAYMGGTIRAEQTLHWPILLPLLASAVGLVIMRSIKVS